MSTLAVAKKKMGRPPTSERDDVSIKFDRMLAFKALHVAKHRKITGGMAAYLSQICKSIIDADYRAVTKEIEEASSEPPAPGV